MALVGYPRKSITLLDGERITIFCVSQQAQKLEQIEIRMTDEGRPEICAYYKEGECGSCGVDFCNHVGCHGGKYECDQCFELFCVNCIIPAGDSNTNLYCVDCFEKRKQRFTVKGLVEEKTV